MTTTYKSISVEEQIQDHYVKYYTGNWHWVAVSERLPTEEGVYHTNQGRAVFEKGKFDRYEKTLSHWLEPQIEEPDKRLVSTDLLLANHLKKEIEDSKNAKAVKELWDALNELYNNLGYFQNMEVAKTA